MFSTLNHFSGLISAIIALIAIIVTSLLTKRANEIEERANKETKRANKIAERASKETKRANEIAKKANELTKQVLAQTKVTSPLI
ncbi:hypothetical protein ACI3E1_07405 [Ligilactobacillus sp. LYQ139]|uniref:hypothetical protein n=1 Tax=Ligilactobacillus sp. LYQ139 TaxID=3378800 RepID=UPI0038540AEA